MRRCSLLLALVALGCQGKQDTKPADPTPEASAQANTPTQKKKSAKPVPEYPAPEAWSLKPLAVGQWIRLAVKSVGTPPSQIFVRIVGQEGDAFWYEIESNTPNGTAIVQFLLEGAGQARFDKSKIRKIRTKPSGGAVQEYTGPMMTMASDVVEEYAAILGQPDATKAERADTTVSAGVFKGCYVHEVGSTYRGQTAKEKTHRHPAVPISGFVRSEGTLDDRPVQRELLEMHETGAKSAMRL